MIDEIEAAEQEGDLLEGPVSPRKHDDHQDCRDGDIGNDRRHAEDGHGCGHADILRDQGAPVDDGEIEDGEPAPERPESVKDRLGVAPLGNSAEPYGHLLDVVRHGHEYEEDPEQIEAVLRTGDRVGGYAARIVVCYHGDDAWSQNDKEKEQSLLKSF